MIFIGNGLIIAGILILIASFLPVRTLLRELPTNHMRLYWKILTTLIIGFIIGYLSFGSLHWKSYHSYSQLIVPAIFFCGAIFVWIVCFLAEKTAREIKQVYILQQENITDPLMEIFNRRYLDRRLNEEFLRAKRYNLSFSIFLLDIDHFKKINDTYGHQVGDLVLVEFAKLIMNSIRKSDVVARYGGEEILVILPQTHESQASLLAERMRHKIEALQMTLPDENEGGKILNITASIGVAGYHQMISDCCKLIEKADEALYRAKKNGRNRVVVSSELT